MERIALFDYFILGQDSTVESLRNSRQRTGSRVQVSEQHLPTDWSHAHNRGFFKNIRRSDSKFDIVLAQSRANVLTSIN